MIIFLYYNILISFVGLVIFNIINKEWNDMIRNISLIIFYWFLFFRS